MFIIVRHDTKGKAHETHVRNRRTMRECILDACDGALVQGRSFKLQQMDLGLTTVLLVEFTDGETIRVNRSH